MPVQSLVTWPELRKPNQTRIKWVLANVVGDTPVIPVCGIYQRLQVATHLFHLIRRKPEDSKYGHCCLHRLSLALLLQSTPAVPRYRPLGVLRILRKIHILHI
ncbi:hypothetical protein SAMN02745126_04694 [Enhydrobacter aerosaccus]|uniref:Uncharacterized protein n=1 Tax=Enhydrobacter aerosaccus TaxID=225324 RepID=A0A1T4SHL7_9HYPH|nr:hypothetical protein SAMN02745126_04694 [Enhydrobacter aerosaccus]